MVGISPINLKILRDIKQARWQFGAVVLIILLGVTIYIGLYQAYLNLQVSYDTTFERLSMADYWVTVDSIGQEKVQDLGKMPGVTTYGRIVGQVSVDLGLDTGEKTEARVISLPGDQQPPLNQVKLYKGAYFTGATRREVLIEKSFAEFHKFEPGQKLTVEHNGLKADYQIAGIVTSPEFIWVVKSEREPMPPPRIFGIIFMPLDTCENLFSMNGLYNEVMVGVAPGTDRNEVLERLREVLRDSSISRLSSRDDLVELKSRKLDILRDVSSAYLVERKNQVSVRMLRQDLEGFSSLAVLFPMLFLSMASLTIYVLMSRMVESQRIQIGIMRAIGYSRLSVLFHYLGFGLFVGVLGSLLGALLGQWLANAYTGLYVSQLNLPYEVNTVHWDVVITGILIGTIIPLASGFFPALITLGFKPADAMRPPVPATGNQIMLRVNELLLGWLPYMLKLPLRNVLRNVRRSFFMSTGIAAAVLIIITSMSFVDAMDQMMNTQFNLIEKYDARVVFQGVAPVSEASYISHLEGVRATEPVLEAAYRVKYKGNFIDTSIMGLPERSTMYNLVTKEGERLDVSKEGVLLPFSFRNKLKAEIGDTLQLEPLVGTTGEIEKKLLGYLEMPIGARGFMPLEEVQKMTRLPGTATSVYLKFEGTPSKDLMKRIYNMSQVASVELASDTRALIDQQMGFFWLFIGVMLFMGMALGVAIIFNGITVNVLQRTREIAIMRAVGLSVAGLTAIITVENLFISIFGVMMGIPAGNWLAEYFMYSMSTSTEDLFSFSLFIQPRTYVIAVGFAILILLVSQFAPIRQVTKMSLATATKEWAE